MPTAARLVAAILAAVSAGLVVLLVVYIYPDLERRAPLMIGAAAVVGLLNGWLGLGKKIGLDEGSGIISGLKSGISVLVWVLLVFAIEGMIAGMLKHAYYQPMDALLQIPARMIRYGSMVLDVQIAGAILGLSVITGIITKRASLKWS